MRLKDFNRRNLKFFTLSVLLFFSLSAIPFFSSFSENFSLLAAQENQDDADQDTIFQIGIPDGYSREFRSLDQRKLLEQGGNPIAVFNVGSSHNSDWPLSQDSTRDYRNAGLKFTYEINFKTEEECSVPTWFIIGMTFSHATEPSLIRIEVNGKSIETKRAPTVDRDFYAKGYNAGKDKGQPMNVSFKIPAGFIHKGSNRLSITLEDGSWIFYDYLVLKKNPSLPKLIEPESYYQKFRSTAMAGIKEILFVVRKPGTDPHWYANFGYYALDENTYPFPLGTGARLCVMDLDSRKVRTLYEVKTGSLRDPQIHYDGKKFIFSCIPDGEKHFHLFEMNLDGTGLKQLTSGEYDDIEPCYLPGGEIVFVSSRTKRWVQCWLTSVATIHRCDANGKNIRELSCNIEHDNTPWLLPNGQILYMRWEYIDRSQVHFHHLWTMNPDGTRQSIYYGNLHPGLLMIDAKPIPNSDQIIVSFSPGHGRREHYGKLTVLSPRKGPDDLTSARPVSTHSDHADPWAFDENHFMAVRQSELQIIDSSGYEQAIFKLSDQEIKEGFWVHEPRPIIKHEREPILADATNPSSASGTLILTDIYQGRRMKNIPRGTVKELLVLETLPEPIHYNGGMDQISYGGTFTLQRVLGTVPVSEDGSANMEIPAMRPIFFVALDKDGNPIKRMHSFTSVMPGETTACIGCHEERTDAPGNIYKDKKLFTLIGQKPTPIKPVKDVPEVFDFPRDIQPILNRYCIECHNYERRDGNADLCGDWTPRTTMSYLTINQFGLLGDNRNRPQSDFEPYQIGSSASKLYKMICENHAGVKMSELDKKIIRFWLNCGGNYAGTYAASGNGIAWSYHEKLVQEDLNWPELTGMKDSMNKKCNGCHGRRHHYLPQRLTSDSIFFNMTRPEKSRMLAAPLAKEAGGLGKCKNKDGSPIFKSKDDPDYKAIFAYVNKGHIYLTKESQRFSNPQPIVPCRPYVREMIRFGVLPPDHDYKTPIDVYKTDLKYWETFHYKPPRPEN